MLTFNFADRFHMTPDARFGSTRRLEFIELQITTVPGWRWALKTAADLVRLPFIRP